MRRLVILFLLSLMVLAAYSNDTDIDHPIVGKWEYVKTIFPDGSEVINLIATEHFYSDGTLLFVNVWLKPQTVNEFTNTPEEIEDNLTSTIGAIGSYKIEKKKEKDKLTYNIITSTRMKDFGTSNSVDIKVEKDILIYYFKDGSELIMKRVKNN
jgi:hypothetical protein